MITQKIFFGMFNAQWRMLLLNKLWNDEVSDPEDFFAQSLRTDKVIATQRGCHKKQKLVSKNFGTGSTDA